MPARQWTVPALRPDAGLREERHKVGCDPAGVGLPGTLPPFAVVPVLVIAIGLGLFLVLTADRWDYHGDELYFLAAGRHLDWGFADQPPLLPLLARLTEVVAPDSLLGLRLPAIVVTTVGTLVTAQIARELGGRRRAQVLAAATYAVSPQVAVTGRFLMTPTVDIFLWALTSLLIVRWVRRRDDRWLLLAGVVVAVALQGKYLIAVFCLAVLAGAALVGPRNLLRRPLLWCGVLLAVLMTLPSLRWQAQHDWPQLHMVQVVQHEVAEWAGGRMAFLPLAGLTAGVVGAVLASRGMVDLVCTSGLRAYRFLGVACAVVVILFFAGGGRYYYCAGIFSSCWAAAAVCLERSATGRWRRLTGWPCLSLSAVLVLTLTWAAPHPWAANTIDYLANETAGWRQLTDTVAVSYRRLPPPARSTAVLVTDHFWQASALDHFGPRAGLPPVYSPSRGYWYFGPPPDNAATVFFVGTDPGPLRRFFRQVREVATMNGAHGFAGINKHVSVWLCTGDHPSWLAVWPQLRRP